MRIVSLTGLVLFMLVSLAVGGRLLWRGGRNRVPELLMGVALFCAGFLAFALGTAGKLFLDASETTRMGLTILGLSLEYVGNIAMALFAWRVFHRRSMIAMAVTTLFALAVCTALTLEITTGEYLRYSDAIATEEPWIPLALVVRAFAPGWLSFECFRFHASLRKRLRLGLAKRIVVHRVALWGVAMLCVTAGYSVSIVHRLLFGTGIAAHPWAVASVATGLLVAAVALGWAFFPPQGYRERLGN